MSYPENMDPIDGRGGSSESPELQLPRKTRYGRIIVPKGDLPGEDQIPKSRKKKEKKPEEPIRQKRKYTKRKDRTTESKDKEETGTVKETTVHEGQREIKEEQPDPDEIAEERESEGEEYDDRRPVRSYRQGMSMQETTRKSTVSFNDIPGLADERKLEPCELCGMVMEKFKMEVHKLDTHPEHARFECLSCRIRSFYDYWELKEHYKLCSNGRIASEPHAEPYNPVIEAAFFRKIYQPVECPFCRIYLGTYFDLDLHFNAHGLAAMDAKFACDGCRLTFISVDALKKHLTRQNTPRQSMRCFNTGRVLNRREIEKMKERFSDADRKDCMRKFNSDTYVLAAPKILECVHAATCAYCHKGTKAYAHIKTDLSNLVQYGLECSDEKSEREIIDKIKHSKEKRNDRVCICRHHFQWRNWFTKKDEKETAGTRAVQIPQTFPQRLITRGIEDATVREMEEGMRVNAGRRPDKSAMGHFSSGKNRPGVMQLDDDRVEEALFTRREVKMEEPEWEDGERRDIEMDMDYDIIDISDEEGAPGDSGGVSLPSFMDHDELEEKMSASKKISFPCPVCKETYLTLQDLHEHQGAHPETKLQYLCADCPDKTYASPDDVYKHFEEKKKSATAPFYSYKVVVQAEGLFSPNQ